MPKILVVEDEPLVRKTIASSLEREGSETVTVGSGEAAIEQLSTTNGDIDLVILDVGLPGISGFETLKRIRARSDIPVIFVTAAGTLAERVAGFDLGADDYVVKPMEIPELARRVRAILRRRAAQQRTGDVIEGPAGIRIHLRSHEAYVGEEQLDLTPKEFNVLRLLLERRGEVVSPDEMSRQVWGYETFGSRNFVEAHISRLRSKLARSGAENVVQTMRGVGYTMR
jgi:DNA-binding response OmpR family regulator